MSNTVVQTNIQALNSHRNLKVVGVQQSRASQRLASGYRINSAADDAAGLAISEKMRSQIHGLDMASKNSADAQSLIQTAEGGLSEIDGMVQRIRELVVYASNDTNDQRDTEKTEGDRQKIQNEIDYLTQEIDLTSERVEFNNKKVINGESTDGLVRLAEIVCKLDENLDAWYLAVNNIQDAMDKLSGITDATGLELTDLYADADSMVTVFNSFSTAFSDSFYVVPDLSCIMGKISAWETSAKLMGKVFTSEQAYALDDIRTNLRLAANAAGSSIDLQLESGILAGDTHKTGLYFQVGPNAGQGMYLSINKIKTDTLGIGNGIGQSLIDVRKETGRNTTEYLNTLDRALTIVTTERSKLGASYNRLEHAIKSLDVTSENLSASESRIRDADMAKEMMNLTKANVLNQAGISMLTQATQAPQSILSLLK
ncbi:MAG: hypothetical protein LBU36_03300 [Clostridiales bacterium]|jgi:flagellin|nr:hypothetical protein [Clostridiales bacterium]